MKNLDIELEGLEEKMRALEKRMKAFEQELKSELVKDGLIESVDSKARIEMKDDYIKLNGKKLSPEMEKKYRKLMKKFEIDIKGDSTWRLDE